MQEWQDLDTGVLQAVDNISTAYDVTSKLFARLESFGTRLDSTANNLELLDKFYVDELESAESSLQVTITT